LKPERVNFLEPSDKVIGVTYNYISKAYPIKILNWHEIVNDYYGKKPVVVTYCPLCGSGMAFKAHIKGKDRTFGVSGLLYNNDVLIYDKNSESLWSQIKQESIAGPLNGTKLEYIQTTLTTWKKWKEMNPYSQVLSTETEYPMNYNENPYGGYGQQKQIIFPVESKDDRYHPKTWTLGIEVNGNFKAYPFQELSKSGGTIQDTFEGKRLTIRFDENMHYVTVKTADGSEYPSYIMYWFAWMAFHPGSEVYTAGK
jgi:hypothetical protein